MKRCLLLVLVVVGLCANAVFAAKPVLKFRSDGSFKIVAFGDLQDDEDMDPQTLAIMNRVLDLEKPDFVVLVGDCIGGGDCENWERVKKAISWVALPMEQRGIPWAIVFGNHDPEHFPMTKRGKEATLEEYAGYPHNLNDRWARGLSGVGANNLLVEGSSSNKPKFAIWLLDSGMYAPKNIGGFEWLHADQISWYSRTSQEMEKKYGAKIPGLMFLHIPVVEVADLYAKGKVVGLCHEPVCCPKVNSGLFAAVLDRGDVKGLFFGHDHVNNFVGEWMGVTLGYVATAGKYALPPDHKDAAKVKGGRVFLITESAPANFSTWMRFQDGSTRPADIHPGR